MPSRLGGVLFLCSECWDYNAGVLRGGGTHHLYHGGDGDDAPVQTVAPIIATIEAMPSNNVSF